MLKPLSVLTYYLKNKRKILPIIAIIALSILGISVTAAISDSMWRTVYQSLGFFNDYYTASISFSPDSELGIEEFKQLHKDLINEIEGMDAKEYYIESDIRSIKITTIFGSNNALILFMDKNDHDKFLDEIDCKVVEGRLPENTSEVILEKSIMKNKDLKLGDKIGSKVDEDEWLDGEYEVVGIIESNDKENENMLAVGYKNGEKDEEMALISEYLIHPKDGQEEALNQQMHDLTEKYPDVEIETKQTLYKEIEEEFNSINQVLWAMNIVVILTITSSIALLNVIFFMQRANEFGLLAAVGYSKSFIIKRTLFESFGSIIFGWLCGIAFSEVVYRIINAQVFDPKGIEGLTIINGNTLLFTVPVPVAVAIFSAGTVLWKLFKMDPISIIERRD
ncbi:ABC transporter permease [Candidatus Dojkabacteria bacterium]|nr:ABC transporter permease [Candidatus Dojkabacteria bacterium]